MNIDNYNYGMGYNMHIGGPGWFTAFGSALVLLVLWSMFWKGLALWHSGRKGQSLWFIILLLVNTAGILEIIYLFFVLKLKASHLFKK